jgi:hypothetical protein
MMFILGAIVGALVIGTYISGKINEVDEQDLW